MNKGFLIYIYGPPTAACNMRGVSYMHDGEDEMTCIPDLEYQ